MMENKNRKMFGNAWMHRTLIALLKKARLIPGTNMPTTLECPLRRLEAGSFRSYPIEAAISETANRVDSLTLGLPASALETVDGVTPNALAMSEIVTIRRKVSYFSNIQIKSFNRIQTFVYLRSFYNAQ